MPFGTEPTSACVRRVLSEQLGMPEDQIHDGSIIQDDLGADSLDCVELVMAFEEEFSIEIIDEESEKITTVSDIIKAIDERLK